MKLFLASRINVTLDLIIPLLTSAPTNLSVAFIPTAADTYTDKPWITDERGKFVELGFQIIDFDIKNKTREVLSQELAQYDIIHVAGGNAFYLLNEMRKSGFDQALKMLLESGKIYSGSSAGTMVMGPTLDYITSLDHAEEVPELTDYSGLGYINERLVPHFGRDKYKTRHENILQEWGDKVTFIADNQVLIINGEFKEIKNIGDL